MVAVINTLGDLYSAPGIFQRVMEILIPGVVVYLDDILISGCDTTENLKRLG